MVCQNLELQEGFNFLLCCILEIRLTLINEGLYSLHSQIPRLFPSHTLASDSFQFQEGYIELKLF
jgi:hypothetical protein